MSCDCEDKRRLDKLERMGTGFGRGWVCRMSQSGRGARLHESERTDGRPTARLAIDDAVAPETCRANGCNAAAEVGEWCAADAPDHEMPF